MRIWTPTLLMTAARTILARDMAKRQDVAPNSVGGESQGTVTGDTAPKPAPTQPPTMTDAGSYQLITTTSTSTMLEVNGVPVIWSLIVMTLTVQNTPTASQETPSSAPPPSSPPSSIEPLSAPPSSIGPPSTLPPSISSPSSTPPGSPVQSPTGAPEQSSTLDSPSKKGLPHNVRAGIVAGIVLGGCIAVIVAYIYLRTRKAKHLTKTTRAGAESDEWTAEARDVQESGNHNLPEWVGVHTERKVHRGVPTRFVGMFAGAKKA